MVERPNLGSKMSKCLLHLGRFEMIIQLLVTAPLDVSENGWSVGLALWLFQLSVFEHLDPQRI